MTSRGSRHGRFRRAIDHGNVWSADAAARELGGLELDDALDLLLLIAAKEPARFQRAAVRWHARFALEIRGLAVAARSSSSVRSPALPIRRRGWLETIAAVAERFRSSAVARAARRRLQA